ncbi:MAG: D-alanine--D-alanine ligase A [Flavobacterium sp. BFFFF2]|nr:MAG: D-alanine--D-alanine ligase A [Flavobacterium sp. BFFFF2]
MTRVAIIMGGFSSEWQISLKSGEVVYQQLDRAVYEPYRVQIFKDKWVCLDQNDNEFVINRNDFSVSLGDHRIQFDVVFNAIHGTPGEDGLMQAYFELLGLPITGCSHYLSALTFNKRDMLSVLRPYGIAMAQSVYINNGDEINVQSIIDQVGLPCFVKPNRSGSSFGISKVHDVADLPNALEKAFDEDHEVLIEQFLAGTEVSVGVIHFQGKTMVLPITEIVSENDFFDYEAKYLGKSQEITPARLDAVTQKKVADTALKVYNTLGMTGFSRSEYILVEGEPHLLEMNTIPGLTNESILPQQAHAAGISMPDLFAAAISEALAKNN